MWTREEAIEFGRASAEAAIDQWKTWGSLQESICNSFDNLRDTLVEYRASHHEEEAVLEFYSVLAKHPTARRFDRVTFRLI